MISRSQVMTDNVKILGILIQQRFNIHKQIQKIRARIQERRILAFNQADTCV
jgi:hypothetical protein